MLYICLLINWPRVSRTRWFWGLSCSWGLHRGAQTPGPEGCRCPAYWWWTSGWTGPPPSACWPALQIVPKCSSLQKWLQPEQTGGLIFHHQHNSNKYTKLKMSLIIKLKNLNNFIVANSEFSKFISCPQKIKQAIVSHIKILSSNNLLVGIWEKTLQWKYPNQGHWLSWAPGNKSKRPYHT